MRLTPFAPGALRLVGGRGIGRFFNNEQHVTGSIADRTYRSTLRPLPRWKEIVWWWIVRPILKARGRMK